MPRVHTISGAPLGLVAATELNPRFQGSDLGQVTQPLDFGKRNALGRNVITFTTAGLGAIGAVAMLHGRGRYWSAIGAGVGAIAFGYLGQFLSQKLVAPPTLSIFDLPLRPPVPGSVPAL